MSDQIDLLAMSPDEVLEWVGPNLTRANIAYDVEVTRPFPAARRQSLLTQLRNRLGWPLPDTPPADVLAKAGSPGLPLADVLMREEARPPHMQRPDLIAELQRRCTSAGAYATAVSSRPR